MSGFAELRNLGVVFRPPSRPLPPSDGQPSPFSAPWNHTVSLLATELRNLAAERIVVELALGESDLRIDGLPRANARLSSDAVRIAFDSMYGPLMYETGRFRGSYYRGTEGWQVNVRAIALGLEALRRVDRYGITKRGEQYTGWKALPASTDPADAIVTVDQAVALIHATVSDIYDENDVAGAFQRDAVREAMRRTHPDRGGDPDDFRRVMRAKELIGA